MAEYYVAVDGSDLAVGSASAPWRTVGRAMRVRLKAGDEVVVKAGIYHEEIVLDQDGTSRGAITLRSERPGGAKLRPPSVDSYSTLKVQGDYVEIEGFDVVGGDGHAIDVEGAHHVTIKNNIVHDSGGSGISTNRSDWLTIENNRVYRNAATNGFQCSGISLWQNKDLAPGKARFRNIIRNNVTYDNVQGPAIDWEHTDGNGIIIDGFHDTNYRHGTLIEGNLSFGNGGKGIHVLMSDHVTVRNNTVWHNNHDTANQGTWRGELSNAMGSHNTWVNNIAVANEETHVWNRAINDVTTGDYVNRDVRWYNNITFNGASGQGSVLSHYTVPSAAAGNRLGVDPFLTDPAAGDFHLSARSPAIDAGSSAFGLGSTDMDGEDRVHGVVDIGADESPFFEPSDLNGSQSSASSAPSGSPKIP